MESLGYTIATLENPKALVPVLEALGRRHFSYGACEEHYETVIKALLLMLEQTLADAFKPRSREVWNAALGFVAETMKRGAIETAALRKNIDSMN